MQKLLEDKVGVTDWSSKRGIVTIMKEKFCYIAANSYEEDIKSKSTYQHDSSY
jgi:hypothetical protein